MYFDVPNKLTTQFVERASLLEELENLIVRPQESQNARIITILGMGGQGKTQLALKYCHTAKASALYKGIFWVNAYSRATAASSFERIAGLIDSSGQSLDSVEEKMDFVQHTIGSWPSPWLMVFDNYDHPEVFTEINKFIPPYVNGTVIITSRHSVASVRLAPQATIKLDGMADNEALDLLFARSFQEKTKETEQIGLDIVRRLGHLPLAIDQAAAYIGTKQLPLSRFLEQYEVRKKDILMYSPGLWDYRQQTDQHDIALDAYTTWDMSFQQLGTDEDRGAMLSLLSTLAFLDPSRISEDILGRATTAQEYIGGCVPKVLDLFIKNGEWDTIKYEDMLVDLLSLSLIQGIDYGNSEISFSMHPLIADRLRCTEDSSQCAFQAVLVVANTLKSYSDLDSSTVYHLPLSRRQDLSAHVGNCLDNIKTFEERWTDEQRQASMICQFYFADYYHYMLMHDLSEELYRNALPVPVDDIKVTDFGMLTFIRLWCELRYQQKYYEEAEQGWLLVLDHEVQSVGLAHPKTLDVQFKLANLYFKRGNLPEAEYRCQLVFANCSDGSAYHSYASLRLLGEIYLSESRLDEAIGAFESALFGALSALGNPSHSRVMHYRDFLASALNAAGRVAEAEVIWKDCVEVFEREQGPLFKGLLHTRMELGRLYGDLGRNWGDREDWKEAEKQFRLAAEGYELSFGEENERTRKARRSLEEARNVLASEGLHRPTHGEKQS